VSDFNDADQVSSWAADAMNWAVSIGLIDGTDDSTLDPSGNANRAQSATMIQRFVEHMMK
jgi:hypothetical protein